MAFSSNLSMERRHQIKCRARGRRPRPENWPPVISGHFDRVGQAGQSEKALVARAYHLLTKRGSSLVAQEVARRMVRQRYGRIINIGSVTSVAGYAGLGPYGASRGGIRQLTMSLADDWGKHGITVNCLALGWFCTAQNRVLYQNKEWVGYLCDRIPVNDPASFVISMPRSFFWRQSPTGMSLDKRCW
jgi:NAD(P)-dependent dehydrogenase (short-subunit alcohol dehydrogenase family)